ncbi:hypothetical protein S101446_01750 [Komagataeibacter europaeus]|nr:hypothetical protein S101446_01750 [Komagataeibacter europaeus]
MQASIPRGFLEPSIWPRADLFVTFDKQFMDWDPEQDARDLAVRLLNLDTDYVDRAEVAGSLGWPACRFNPDIVSPVSATDRCASCAVYDTGCPAPACGRQCSHP